MDKHMTYDKEKLLNVVKGEEKAKKDKFIWSYMLRPVSAKENEGK
jgi:hypothetical protein